ncbi:ferrous iron transport protein A [Lebetimonas natsushimae]|uniref:Ferrous iron transport protein A n=1 Tax=Lebetimonas natsushimae TaxID=1936991 RepID=A0A292YCE5_9BACT|nr:FeoA family protein [Lebetimonas natsushimae]GAX87727.1 ferrous iron transport protein A [Lebetimonas natsushimae]
MKLNELKMGESGIITKILAKDPLKSRLLSMGFARGERVKVLKHTLAKNTYEVEVNRIPIALREEEAAQIEVRRENEGD